jgi:hypothetical protein
LFEQIFDQLAQFRVDRDPPFKSAREMALAHRLNENVPFTTDPYAAARQALLEIGNNRIIGTNHKPDQFGLRMLLTVNGASAQAFVRRFAVSRHPLLQARVHRSALCSDLSAD